MTNDIVARLRRDLALGLSASIGDTKDAADEIERLRAEIARKDAALMKIEAFVESIAASRNGVLEIVRAALALTSQETHTSGERVGDNEYWEAPDGTKVRSDAAPAQEKTDE